MLNHQTRLLVGGAIIAAVMIAGGLIRTAGAGPGSQTFIVNERFDSGTGGCTVSDCTMREAILAANAAPGADAISFDPAVFPPGGNEEVIPDSPLPKIEASAGITIDGTGAGVTFVGVEVFGTEHEAGLYFRTNPGVVARDIVVRNITIDFFATGIRVCSGEVALPPPQEPVCGYNAENVLLENISVRGSNNELDEVGMVVKGANLSDIAFENAIVQGATFNAVVVSAGNDIDGVVISGGEQSSGEFGIIVDAVNALANVTIENALVSGDRAIVLDAAGADNLLVEGNTAEGGVFFAGMGENNRIVDNELYNAFDRDGVAVASGRVTISRNSIYGNDKLGINLFSNADPVNGVTPNDAGDTDSGPNDLLNFPVLNGVSGDFVTGTACAGCLVELFLAEVDPSGYGEGKTFLRDATADGSGNFAVSICGLSVVAGNQVTATATNGLGNTSEFSLNYALPLTPGACPSPSPTPTASPSPTPTATPVASPTPTSTPVATPSPTVTPTPTQTPAATPSPTATSGGGDAAWGDSDCNGAIGARDNQALLRHVLDQGALSQTEPCPDLGETVDGHIWGDWDCSGAIGARDNQALLRQVLSQPPLSQTEPCPDIGSST